VAGGAGARAWWPWQPWIDPDVDQRCRVLVTQGAIMTWETPTAIDFRFGMEITMYVNNR
jgi:coenzyme PQQ precursor peptide PqqA